MEKCAVLGDALSAYLDGELDEAESRVVSDHLANCAHCSAEFEGLRQGKRFIAAGSPLAPALPRDLVDRVRSNVYPRTRKRGYSNALYGRLLRLPRAWLVVPALALLLIVAMLVADNLGIGLFAPSPAAAAATASLNDHIFCARLGQVIGSLPGDANQVSTELAGTLGISIALPRELPPGFSFAGGRTIRPDNIEAAHLAWTNGKTMLSFYEAADPGGDPPANWLQISVGESSFWYAPSGGEHAVLWRGAGTLYLLVGDLPEDTLLQSALSANPIP